MGTVAEGSEEVTEREYSSRAGKQLKMDAENGSGRGVKTSLGRYCSEQAEQRRSPLQTSWAYREPRVPGAA